MTAGALEAPWNLGIRPMLEERGGTTSTTVNRALEVNLLDLAHSFVD